MATLAASLALRGNPFEHYTAETEPHISEYAVKPPYLEAISARGMSLSSFILFGDRGAGKSATRITLFNELWRAKANEVGGGRPAPLAVNLIDFTRPVTALKAKAFGESQLIEEVAFLVIEQVLAWLSSLPAEESDAFTGARTNSSSHSFARFTSPDRRLNEGRRRARRSAY